MVIDTAIEKIINLFEIARPENPECITQIIRSVRTVPFPVVMRASDKIKAPISKLKTLNLT
jgi:hypothetical protein